jgi:DNA polymerase-2
VGRLEDGRSFAAVEENWRPPIHIFEKDRTRALPLFSSFEYNTFVADLQSFSGEYPLVRLVFSRYGGRAQAARILENAGIPSPDGDIKPQDLYFIEKDIRGPVEIRQRPQNGMKIRIRPGRRVDLVIQDCEICPPRRPAPGTAGNGSVSRFAVPLRTASIDIETDTADNSIRAAAIICAGNLSGPAPLYADNVLSGRVRVLSAAAPGSGESGVKSAGSLFFHSDEKSLLAAFLEDLRLMDPDVLTGWNFLEFDFRILSERCAKLGIPFRMGRSCDEAKFFPSEQPGAAGSNVPSWRRRSSAAVVPGRQVLDALRVIRSGSWGRTLTGSGGDGGPSDFSLESVSRAVLGEGKTVASSGDEKIAELDKLYAEDKVSFGKYCYRDAELALRILAKTGLFTLTVERALLTGVSLDKAWTSVVSFERIYGIELRKKGIAPPASGFSAKVSGAAGGTVLDPRPGLFRNVAVFDFRSLYPTIMRTFNIDPLAHVRIGKDEAGGAGADLITAPNGAVFSRPPGILPALIAEYFTARRKALDEGDAAAAQVYKILMNSFYGVLGTAACRYGRTELAGAITSFARKWLLFSRDWFTEQGYGVLYGDTDSLFVETDLGDDAVYEDFLSLCGRLAEELNRRLSETIRGEYNLSSYLELRFEKAYRRFLLPPLRNPHPRGGRDDEGAEAAGTPRGRAKGYSGYLIQSPRKDGGSKTGAYSVEVKGMEAVRSDSTPLARRLQMELLELVFSGSGVAAFKDKINETLRELRGGKLDDELVYRKRLTRSPEFYTASTPPQVKAARALGWKNRRGVVEFVWTKTGAEPLALRNKTGLPFDYDHYVNTQILPLALSVASAAHWNMDEFLLKKKQGRSSGEDPMMQPELGWR